MINPIKYTLILFLLILSSSCSKLNLKPTDVIDAEKAYRNLNDIDLGLNGVYVALDNTLIGINAIISDEVMLPTENTVSNTDAHRWLYTGDSDSVTGSYYTYYTAIDRLNRVLAGLDVITVATVDIATRDRYRGELLALRAFCHFELLRMYGSVYQNGGLGVPYMKASKVGYPSRDAFEVVVADAKADLVAAKSLIPLSFNDKTRITKVGVSAIQARLALYEKNWSEAITYATEAINLMPLATAAQFPGIWTDATDNEVIWKLKRGIEVERTGNLFYRQSGNIVLYAPSFKLINSFDKDNDVRYTAYIKFDDTRGEKKSQYLVNKYAGTEAFPGLADIKLFRTGEMYLIRAEAEAESAGDAAGDLNALRKARIKGYVSVSFAGKDDLVSAIYTERFKELAFEGHRFFDLKRRNLPVQRLPEDAINTSGAVKLLPTQAQYALPLPALEISVNKNTFQNPNY
ncbi:RagB/SusD family nutrient uptake outer membrane protein [Pedobacter sp. PAMC26386]|nr:RagB/SusD family nutrient uptake outer membrane protein [Pedobacter sp. PAMC26386]